MRRLPLRTRVTVLVVGLLALFLLLAIAAVSLGSLRFARERVAADLKVAQRVAERQLDQDQARLAQAARVLSADFGFRDAIASGDAPTINSALANNARRIRANAAIVLDLDGRVIASTLDGALGTDPGLHALFLRAREHGGADGVVTFAGQPRMVVVSPVLAPVAIAWVVLGFDLDDATVRQMAGLTGSEVAVLTQSPGGYQLSATSIDPSQRLEFSRALAEPPRFDEESRQQLHFDGSEYLALRVPVDTGGGTSVVLLQSVDAALAPYQRLVWALAGLLALAFLAAAFASRWVARTVSEPIQRLADAADAVSQGDYAQTLPDDTRDEIGRLSASFNAMSRAVAAREDQISRLAYTDLLTGLRNRAGIQREGADLLAHAQEHGAVVVDINIARFKAINDTLGYDVGDQVICEVARRLRQMLREEDPVARLSGDNFAVLITGPLARDLAALHQRIEDRFASPVEVSGTPLDMSLAVGMARYPEHGADMGQLLRNAEIALHVAKRRQSGYAVYAPELEQNRRSHLSLLSELRRAVERDELMVFLQPKVQVSSGAVDGAEALVRWMHPQRGLIPPGEFIPFAEQAGRIGMLTRWMLFNVMRLTRELAEEGEPLRVSVNVAAQDVQDARFPAELDHLLARSGASPEHLRLEITESGVMDNPERALAVLHDLRARGFSLSLDDFGTGYSSLAYLRRLPVAELKIDRSFIHGMHEDSEAAQLVRSTIGLGHTLGLSVVAEGVELAQEWRLLQDFRCDEIQGFYASRPLPVDDFLRWRDEHAPFTALRPQHALS